MKPKKINIAIIGFGNIGSFFYKILEKNKKTIATKTGRVPFVKYISAKNINKKRSIKIPKTKLPHLNAGGGNNEIYEKFYTDDLKQFVYEQYKEEFEIFGYDHI